jgi:ribosomal protein S27AE
MTQSNSECPECGAELQTGFVSHGSGLVWHGSALRGWKRLFPWGFATGQPIVGNWTSSGLMTSRPAKQCPVCGTIVLPRVAERWVQSGRSKPAA